MLQNFESVKFKKKVEKTDQEYSFWEHLEQLRWVFLRIIIVVVLLLIIVFSFYNSFFSKILFAPLDSHFWIYEAFCTLSRLLKMPSLCPPEFHIQLINIEISGQFMVNISSSFYIAAIFAIPYIIFEIWGFISPALYPEEKKNVNLIFLLASVLFYIGATVAYFIVFPLTIRFLGTYQISELVPNQISIQSYFDTFFLLLFSLGASFEMPVLTYLLSRVGILNREILKKFRQIAFVVILIVAAVITPTTDPFTMMVVALPLYGLYELSILMCKSKKSTDEQEEVSDPD